MNYTIKSKSLSVTVSDRGAELQSIFSPLTGKEYLWQGNPAVWGGRAPVLFPFIGASKEGKYVYNGETYAAPRHGFARGAYFYLSSFTENKISFEYKDNAFTRKYYPFAFTLTVSFSLEGENGGTLRVENRAENHGAGAMPFCVGAHEAYGCAKLEDYYLEFLPETGGDAANLKSETVILTNGLLSEESYGLPFKGNILPLDYSLFDRDTLVFRDIKCKKVALKSKTSNDTIEVEYDAPNLAVWTMAGPGLNLVPGSRYVCIEPWFGTPGYENGGMEITDRPGAVCLPPGAAFVSEHRIKISQEVF